MTVQFLMQSRVHIPILSHLPKWRLFMQLQPSLEKRLVNAGHTYICSFSGTCSLRWNLTPQSDAHFICKCQCVLCASESRQITRIDGFKKKANSNCTSLCTMSWKCLRKISNNVLREGCSSLNCSFSQREANKKIIMSWISIDDSLKI